MPEIERKSSQEKRTQTRIASLLFDQPHYFSPTQTQLAYPDQSRLEGHRQWGEYVEALRLMRKGKRYAEQLGTFLEREEVTPSPLQLVDAQRDVVEEIRHAFEEGRMHGTIVLPTGAGKTAIFVKVAEALGLRTLIVTPSQIGVEQIQETFADLQTGDHVGAVYAQDKQYDKRVTVTTYDSLRINRKEGSLPEGATRDGFYTEDYDLVILDEAHMSLTPDRIAIARSFRAARLATTATPVFNEEKEVEGAFGPLITRMSIEEASNAGLIAEKISAHVVRTSIDLSDLPTTASGEYEESAMARRINTPARNNAAVDVYLERFFGEQLIVRCINIEHADAVKAAFEQRFRDEAIDLKIAVVHSRMPRREVDRILQAVKNGEIDIVVSAKLLDFAFDAPRVGLAFNLTPTLSRVTEEQFGGRIIRKDRATGQQKHAIMVDFLDVDTNAGRVPVTYAQILGAPSITSRHYIEPTRRVRAAYTGVITGTSGSTWRYIDDPTEIKQLIRQLDAQDINIDINDFVTFPDVLAALPGERREKLIRTLADNLRTRDYRRFKIPSKKVPSTLYPRTILARLPAILEREYQIAPEDWVTEITFAQTVGRKWQTFKRLIDADLEAHPERRDMVRTFWNKRGRSRYLNPDYQTILSRELHRPVLPKPDGYNTVGTRALQEVTGFAGTETLMRTIDQLVNAHARPDWVIRGFWTGERTVNLYADELVGLLKQQNVARTAIPQAITGSKTLEDFRRRIAPPDFDDFRAWIEKYIADNPDDPQVGLRRGSQGNVAINVNPEREDSLLDEFRTAKRGGINLPSDHIRLSQLADEICAALPGRNLKPASVSVAIRRWLERQGIPQLQKYRYDLGRKPSEALSRDLADRIKKEAYGIQTEQ